MKAQSMQPPAAKKQQDQLKQQEQDYSKTHSSPYHVIFSTGCSTFQDWKSYIFFYHVLQSGQEGHVTIITSGCSSKVEERSLLDVFVKEIEPMNPGNHHLHLTPHFSNVPKKMQKPFKYFNKPFGVRHWFEKVLGYPDNHELYHNSVVILLDPDRILLRLFTRDFSHSSKLW